MMEVSLRWARYEIISVLERRGRSLHRGSAGTGRVRRRRSHQTSSTRKRGDADCRVAGDSSRTWPTHTGAQRPTPLRLIRVRLRQTPNPGAKI